MLAIALVLTACVGGDDSYAEKMETACDERDRAFNDLVQPIPAPAEVTDDYKVAVVEGSVELIRDYLVAVEDIGPPGGDLDDEHERYVQLIEEQLATYEAAVDDRAAAVALYGRPAPQFREVELQLGMPTCGTPGNGLEPND